MHDSPVFLDHFLPTLDAIHQKPPSLHCNLINGKDRYRNIRACRNCGSQYHFNGDSNRPVSLATQIGKILKSRPYGN